MCCLGFWRQAMRWCEFQSRLILVLRYRMFGRQTKSFMIWRTSVWLTFTIILEFISTKARFEGCLYIRVYKNKSNKKQYSETWNVNLYYYILLLHVCFYIQLITAENEVKSELEILYPVWFSIIGRVYVISFFQQRNKNANILDFKDVIKVNKGPTN